MKRPSRIVLGVVFFVCHAAFGCDSGTVRDAAYHAKRDMHRLCLFSREGDTGADAQASLAEQWFAKQPAGLNITFERVNAGDPSVAWHEYGIPSAPPVLPVTALIGRFNSLRRTFVVDHWEAALTEEDLAILRNSPGREAIKNALLEFWAVILYAPGRTPNAGLQPIFDAVIEKWSREQSPGVTVVRFARSEPRERVLTAFAGLAPDGPDWVGVVFGRGKLMAPPLTGETITETALNRLIGALAVPCTCLQESLTLGLDLPMVWEPELDAKFASILAHPIGYSEITFEQQAEALAAEVPDTPRRLAFAALGSAALLGGTGLGITGWLIWRARRAKRLDGV